MIATQTSTGIPFQQLKQGRSNNPTIDRARYTMMRNKVVSMLRNSKQEFFNKLNNANANQFWKILRLLNWNSSAVPTLQDCDTGTAIDTSVDKANALNTFFHSCFNHNFPTLSELPCIFQLELPAVDCPVELLSTEDSGFELLSTLDTFRSSGSDGISAKMLKELQLALLSHSQLLSIYLFQLVNYQVNGKLLEWLQYQNQERIRTVHRGIDQSLSYQLQLKSLKSMLRR